MTLTTSPSIRPSSSTRTTSSDLRSARRDEGDETAAGVDGAFAAAWTLPEWIAADTACEHDHHVEHHRNAVAA